MAVHLHTLARRLARVVRRLVRVARRLVQVARRLQTLVLLRTLDCVRYNFSFSAFLFETPSSLFD